MDIFEDNSPTNIIFYLEKKEEVNNDTLDIGKKKKKDEGHPWCLFKWPRHLNWQLNEFFGDLFTINEVLVLCFTNGSG